MHEALIQIRKGHELTGKEVEAIKVTMRRYVGGRVKAEVFELKSGKGLNIYVSSLGAARRMASKMARSLNGKISESTKYLGMRDGRRRYRFHIRVRLAKS